MHGNKAASSKCGSADILIACGCQLENVGPEKIESCIDAFGFGFLYAPNYHPSLAKIASLRKDIGVPTIFNLLGPLINPAGPQRIIIGVHSKYLGPIFIEALSMMGLERAMVVNGEIGLDEISPQGKTCVLV
jgi:anthranilate phosphoribosyltransferase